MTWVPINDSDLTTDGQPLASALGVRLAGNAEHVFANRLKRHSTTFYLGPTSTSGGTPPVGDSTLVGPTVDVRGSAASDAEGIGLKISSPPTTPVVMQVGQWPLSAGARYLRLVVGCATDTADVDMYAFATINGAAVPVSPSRALVVDADGVASFASSVTDTAAHVTVGTATPSAATQNAKPVVLTIDMGTVYRDHGKHVDSDRAPVVTIYLAILSTRGALDGAMSQSSASSWGEDGRRVETPTSLSTWGQNPGPFHRWILFQSNSSAVDDSSAGWEQRTAGVLQLRPHDLSALATTTADLVIHPPVPVGSILRLSTGFFIYTVGTVTIHSISVQEVAA